MILNGKKIAKKKSNYLNQKISNFASALRLDIIYIGNNKSSEVFIGHKRKTAKKIGIHTKLHKFSENVKLDEIQTLCNELNNDKNCTGYFFQLPIQSKLNDQKVLELIDPEKDVDCLTSANLGKVAKGIDTFAPATVEAIISIFERTGLDLESKRTVIINDSNLIGKPLSLKMLNRKATVSVCNKYTKNIKALTEKADIVISATGVAKLIKEDMVKHNSVLIDVGFSKKDGHVEGDIDFEAVKNKVKLITPVPSGVGPLTVVYLFENLVKLYENQTSRSTN